LAPQRLVLTPQLRKTVIAITCRTTGGITTGTTGDIIVATAATIDVIAITTN
jgi:hypothetical protein